MAGMACMSAHNQAPAIPTEATIVKPTSQARRMPSPRDQAPDRQDRQGHQRHPGQGANRVQDPRRGWKRIRRDRDDRLEQARTAVSGTAAATGKAIRTPTLQTRRRAASLRIPNGRTRFSKSEPGDGEQTRRVDVIVDQPGPGQRTCPSRVVAGEAGRHRFATRRWSIPSGVGGQRRAADRRSEAVGDQQREPRGIARIE